MFNTVESFSVFFFACLALVCLGIIFEEKLIENEVKLTNKRKENKAREKDTQMHGGKRKTQKGA